MEFRFGSLSGDLNSEVLTEASPSIIEARKNLIEKIFYMSRLNSKCSEATDICIMKMNREKAVLLKLKHLYIEGKIAHLQELLKTLDNTSELKKEAEHEILNSISLFNFINHRLLEDDIVKILGVHQNSGLLLEIEDILEKEGFSKANTNVLSMIENAMQTHFKAKNRRRYKRGSELTSILCAD
ncbi:unnamed protein product [Blepharisma stoltei]|uniref:Uncharacterized protein n=1 Tax=Blepharisma stoltei TaxID=1481888 RepID=A0AAU9J3I1_9CILI|nr:unnamed protein product [Blepharisma stoltei]